MIKDNQNIKIVVGLVLLLVVIILTIIVIMVYGSDKSLSGISGIEKSSNLDEYKSLHPELFMKKNDENALGISEEEVSVPITLKVKDGKIMLVPKLLGGGDIVYEPVLSANGYYAQITENNIEQIFSVKNGEEALKYVDFLRTKIGKTSYDRARETVWNEQDYEKIGCKGSSGEDLPLPSDKVVSQAKEANSGWEVNWIYFSPTVPAGYFKEVFFVGKDGHVELKEKEEKPFWPCGVGILF